MATALVWPVLLVVFGVGHYSQDIHFMGFVEDASDEAVFISAEVEHCTVSDEVRRWKRLPELCERHPVRGQRLCEPRPKRNFGARMDSPELA
jgi:hypothetical protein